MEYNLIKTIETNYGYVANEEIVMTPFPSDLIIIPGVGQIINNLSIITKVHNSDDLTKISKKNEFEINNIEQSGSGENDDILKTNADESEKNSDDKTSDKEKVDIPFNEQKRKSMDESVYQSLMHPKMFKTNSMIFTQTVKTPPKKTGGNEAKTIQNDGKKKIVHKFQVYD